MPEPSAAIPEPSGTRISAGESIRDGFQSLTRPPFRGILLLAALVSLVSNTIPTEGDSWSLTAGLFLAVVSLYLQIAATLAAATFDPSPSVDVWLKKAFARRCFWRYLAVSILVMIAVVFSGVLGLIVGAFIVGGICALADPAAVLEHRAPAEAIVRSAELSKPSRGPLAVVFGLLILIPGISVQVGSLAWDLREIVGPGWPALSVLVLVLGLAGTIALTRAYIALGGRTLPAKQREPRGAGTRP